MHCKFPIFINGTIAMNSFISNLRDARSYNPKVCRRQTGKKYTSIQKHQGKAVQDNSGNMVQQSMQGQTTNTQLYNCKSKQKKTYNRAIVSLIKIGNLQCICWFHS